MENILINTSKKYNVLIDNSLLEKCGKLTLSVKNKCKALIVSDNIVFSLYGQTAVKSFKDNGFEVETFIFENGEKSKNFITLINLLEFCASCYLTRSDLLIALGGGVVGDLTGFAASVYLRGIDYIQIPTTLLAAIDSSVGGKTAIDIKNGKNLVGAFHNPKLVICDTNTFNTLPDDVFSDGMGEAIKYGLIQDKDLFNTILNLDIKYNINSMVSRCISIKKYFVEKDEYDLGLRQILNFGHTIGHAIESLSNYTISHGKAVGIGMYIITKAAENSENLNINITDDIKKVLTKYNIPHKCCFNAKDLVGKILSDKKRNNNNINLVLLKNIGEPYLYNINISNLETFIDKGLE